MDKSRLDMDKSRLDMDKSGHGQIPTGHGQIPTGHGQIPTGHGQIPAGHGQIPTGHGQIPTGHGQIPTRHGQIPTRHGQIPAQAGIEPRVYRSGGGHLNHWDNEAVPSPTNCLSTACLPLRTGNLNMAPACYQPTGTCSAMETSIHDVILSWCQPRSCHSLSGFHCHGVWDLIN